MNESTKAGARPTREERLAAALRENLKRRKAQARGRQGAEKSTEKSTGKSGETPGRADTPRAAERKGQKDG
jgi:hypothetical protein